MSCKVAVLDLHIDFTRAADISVITSPGATNTTTTEVISSNPLEFALALA